MANKNVDGNASKLHIMIFDTILRVNGLFQNTNAKSTKMAKIGVANSQLPVCFKSVFCVS